MKTKAQVKEELRQLKYYFLRKDAFAYSTEHIIKNQIVDLAEQYNELVVDAPADLYDAYIMLYTSGYSQMEMAEEIEASPEYVSRLNTRLITFLTKKFNALDEKNE